MRIKHCLGPILILCLKFLFMQTVVAGDSSSTDFLQVGKAITVCKDAIQPHMVVSHEGVFVTCIHKGNIVVSVSRDDGRSFSQPVKAIDVNGHAKGGAQRGPRIGVDANGNLTVTAPVTFDKAEYKRRYPTADLYFSRSTDGGKSWSQPIRINESEKKAPEALHWMAVSPLGDAHVAWLDLRNRDGPGQDIFYTRIVNGRVGKNVNVATTVCECCAPGLAVDANSNPIFAFREGGDKASREIFARRSQDAGNNFSKLFQVNSAKTLEGG